MPFDVLLIMIPPAINWKLGSVNTILAFTGTSENVSETRLPYRYVGHQHTNILPLFIAKLFQRRHSGLTLKRERVTDRKGEEETP